jgi:hypothetical protein
MPELILYDGNPVAIMLPSSALPVEEVCERLSPQEGLCDSRRITEEQAAEYLANAGIGDIARDMPEDPRV